MTPQLSITLAAAACLTGGLVWVSRRPPANAHERAVRALLPLALLGTLAVAWAAGRLFPHWTWSAARLAASVRLALGFPLYSGPHDALVNDWIYGPVSALAYLPAALADEPLAALRIAMGLNFVFFLLPPLVLFLGVVQSASTRLDGILLVSFCTAVLMAPYGLWYVVTALSADVVTMALGVVSCIVLTRTRQAGLAAALCVLAMWSKQIEAPLAPAQLLFLGGFRGFRSALIYAGWLALAGAAALAGFGAWFGLESLWHCMVVIPRGHPFEWHRLGPMLQAFALVTSWIWLLALARWRWRGNNSAATASEETGWLLLLASLVLLPGGLLAAIKSGGGENSIHSLYYAILGGAVLGAQYLSPPAGRMVPVARSTLLAGIFVAAGLGLHRAWTNGHLQIAAPGIQHREAHEFAQAHPGQVYFPWNPLVNLMAERRNYPFDFGLYEWRLARQEPPAADVRRLLPPALKFVVYHGDDQSREMLRIFPEFNRVYVSGPWLVHTRNAGVEPNVKLRPAELSR